MRAYADSSFLVKLLSQEPDSPAVVAAYRRLDRPPLFFLPLHALEVRNAIYQRGFFQRHTGSADERTQISRQQTAALSKLEQMVERRGFLPVAAEWDAALDQSQELSDKHTAATGARAFDILHVAFALQLNCELFFTSDERQARLAKAEGLKLVVLPRS